MSLALYRRADLSSQQVSDLEAELGVFYQNPPANYYAIADQAARHYHPKEQPFHCDLIQQVHPGISVIELGCGTAHLCAQVETKGGTYTGLDHGEQLLQQNQVRFPKAHFHAIGTRLDTTFDLVASLYTIEHVVDPPAYLEQMWRLCRPGGLLAIICPEFIESPAPAPSIFYGQTPRRLREKVQGFAPADALGHLLDLKVRVPRWQAQARASLPGAFWINLRPRVLHGSDYSIDADAVHMTRLKDLVWFLQNKGAEIVHTSADLPGVSPEILRFNCYVLARKPRQSEAAP